MDQNSPPNQSASEGAQWIDTHCHLADEKFADDLAEVVCRAHAEGVSRMVVIADSVLTSARAVQMAERNAAFWPTVGVHPHNAEVWNASVEAELRALLDVHRERIVAVGEVGLDFFYGFSQAAAQESCFLAQSELARRYDLPLVIHLREAIERFCSLVKKHALGEIGGVVHCFTGTQREAAQLTDAGFYLGIGGILTFKRSEELRQVVREIPRDRLVLETDSPYLAPAPRRGKRNEPALLIHTARVLAQELGLTEKELSAMLYQNSLRLFRRTKWQLDQVGAEGQ